MNTTNELNIDEETIKQVGLLPSDAPLNAQTAPGARIFKYPHLEEVYIMESDLYGNAMPKDSCFIAFNGNHGFIGKHLMLSTLKSSSVNEIKAIIEANENG
jgi:hypothetical protein